MEPDDDAAGEIGSAATPEDPRRHVDTGLDPAALAYELTTHIDFGVSLVQLEPHRNLYLNPAYLRIFGFDAEGSPPTPADSMAIVHADDLDRARSAMASFAGGRLDPSVWRIVRRDGTERWVSARVSPITDEDGVVRRAVGMFEDITDRKATEEALRESQKRFEQFARSTEAGFMLREANQVLYTNDSFRRIMGLALENETPSRMDLAATVHPDDRDAVAAAVDTLLDQGEPTTLELRLVRPDGEVRWIRATNDPVAATLSSVARVAVTVVDITDRRIAEAAAVDAQVEAERANAAKTEFLSRMSHELRTPLNAILGFGQLLDTEELDDEQREGVRHILRAGRHLLCLVDEVLDITSMERGEMRLSLEPVDVGSVVEEAVGMIRPLAVDRDIIVTVDNRMDGLHVQADRQRLQQVVVNLLANAVKYNRDGGEVHVHLDRRDSARLRLIVTDTGMGIGEEDLAKLFRPFERLEAEGTGVEGTGLGLALTQQLVALMGGRTGVASRLGEGSNFWVEFAVTDAPSRDRADQSPGPHAASAASAASAARGILLYIEDNASNTKLLELILARRPDVTLLAASLGRDGVNMAFEHRPDLVLLDLHLPDVSGEQVLRELRGDPRTALTPIVVVSADATTGQPRRLLAQGANDYLTKPLDVDHILALVDALCRSPGGREGTERSAGPVALVHATLPPLLAQQGVDPEFGDAGLAAFVHDLVNTIGVIMNYSVLAERRVTDATTASYLEEIRTEADRAVRAARLLLTQSPATPTQSGE
jgi:PAS domain S-box-containing protein